MADVQLSAREAFAGLLHPLPAPDGGPPRLELSARPGARLATVIARAGDRAALAHRLGDAFGLALPEGPRRTAAGRLSALGVGPRAWLLTEDGGAPDLAGRLAAALGTAAAICDQSDGYAVLRVAGPAARAVLAKGLAVDLHPRAFDGTSVAVTACAHVGVTVWQADDGPTFEIALARSYAGSFAHWLRESAAEFGCLVRSAA